MTECVSERVAYVDILEVAFFLKCSIYTHMYTREGGNITCIALPIEDTSLIGSCLGCDSNPRHSRQSALYTTEHVHVYVYTCTCYDV